MGDAGAGARPEAPGEEAGSSSRLAMGCLVVALVTLFVVVVVPALLWAAGILLAGGR